MANSTSATTFDTTLTGEVQKYRIITGSTYQPGDRIALPITADGKSAVVVSAWDQTTGAAATACQVVGTTAVLVGSSGDTTSKRIITIDLAYYDT